MKIIGKLLLFFSSYLILFLILFINSFSDLTFYCSLKNFIVKNDIINIISSFIYFIFICLSIFCLLVFRHNYKYGTRNNKQIVIIDSISNSSSELISYLLTMVIPLITVNPNNIIFTNNFSTLLSSLIIIFFISLLYINTNLIIINPMLLLFGYRIYNIEYFNMNKLRIKGFLIIKNKIKINNLKIKNIVYKIDDDIFIYRRI